MFVNYPLNDPRRENGLLPQGVEVKIIQPLPNLVEVQPVSQDTRLQPTHLVHRDFLAEKRPKLKLADNEKGGRK